MADVFESRAELEPWREKLWSLIAETPALDWLLLTKRPENCAQMVPWGHHWPSNVWLGSTAENQRWAAKRIPQLLANPARILFLSAEPLLGKIDIRQWLRVSARLPGIDWVIAGGESGPKARPMNPQWVESLRDQCIAAGVAFHFKQWGHWGPVPIAERVKVVSIELASASTPITLFRLGKHANGRLLNGRTWDDLPQSLAEV